jgi:hypothetical protein
MLLARFRQPAIELFSIAFGPPKPMHGFVLSNWSRLTSARFRLITDSPTEWRPLLGENTELIETSIDAYFRAAYPLLGVADDADFERMRAKFMGVKNGWSACGLRPLLPRLFGLRESARVWGWIDYDVLVNARELERHIARCKKQVLLCPPPGQVLWEQFKLFRRGLDITDLYRALVADDDQGSAPMEARLVYALERLDRATRDRMDQRRLAVHWAYADHRWTLQNQVDVTMDASHRLFAPGGAELLAFIADTQVKQWDHKRVSELEHDLKNQGRTAFAYERQ